MPVTTGTFSANETLVYGYLRTEMKFNPAICCGILANIQEESKFNHQAGGDNGGAYGLFQWNSRRPELIAYCTKSGLSHATVSSQLAFMRHELMGKESETMEQIKDLPNTASGAFDAGDIFCRLYERPAGAEDKGRARGRIAVNTYWNYYSIVENDLAATSYGTTNIGQKIVKIAREQIGKPFATGGVGPNEFDDIGLIKYCYAQVGIVLPDHSMEYLVSNYLENKAKKLSSIYQAAAGDILVYTMELIAPSTQANVTYTKVLSMAISNGDGGSILAGVEKVTEMPDIKFSPTPPSRIYRIIGDAQTSQGPIPEDTTGNNSPSYESIASNDPYASVVAENLSKVTAEGFKEGYLIDMTHGEIFKFYVPEFEESAGANWTNIDIIGRSVSVVAYNNTSSRSIQVSLELYAGVGMYDVQDPVDKLHSDANFLKSLEYPDYTNPITRPPATVHLILGSAVSLVGVVSNVVVNHMKPLDEQNRSMYLKVSFKVTQTAVNPPDYIDIAKGQYAIAGTENVGSINPEGTTPTNAPVFSRGIREVELR